MNKPIITKHSGIGLHIVTHQDPILREDDIIREYENMIDVLSDELNELQIDYNHCLTDTESKKIEERIERIEKALKDAGCYDE